MRFENFLEDLRSTSKPEAKQDILLKYDCELLRYIIKATYEPFKMFHVNIKASDIPPSGNYDLSEKIEDFMRVLYFCEESNSNKQNRSSVCNFLAELNVGSQQLVVNVLDKNWKAGLAAKNILKVFPNIISTFSVQLANTYKKDNKLQAKTKRWLLSYKLDGLRCVALRESSDEFYDKGKWTLYSRKGKEFLTVEHIKNQLEFLYKKHGWTFFDGELYRHGLLFEEVQGLVMAFTQGQSPELQYHVFVGGQAEKFLAGEDPNHVTPMSITMPKYEETSDIVYTSLGFVDNEDIYDKLEEAFSQNYEGIMLRDPNYLYDYKRSNAILKLKQGESEETNEVIISDCIVTDIELDSFPVIYNEKMSFEKMVVRLIVRQPDGIICKIGSGLTLETRRLYRDDPTQILGKTIEVEHQKWGKNGRMRFPRIKKVRLDL